MYTSMMQLEIFNISEKGIIIPQAILAAKCIYSWAHCVLSTHLVKTFVKNYTYCLGYEVLATESSWVYSAIVGSLPAVTANQ